MKSEEWAPCDGCGKVGEVAEARPVLGDGKFCRRCIASAVAQEGDDGR